MGLKPRIRLFAFLLVSAIIFPWASFAAAPPKADPLFNIILLTPDQLRADYMHTYGFPYPDTPNIDQLAREGTVFTRA